MNMKKLEAIFSESQVMMLIEEFNSNLQLVYEGISSIDKKIDTVEERLTEEIKHVDLKVNILNEKIDNVEARLNAKIDGVEARLNARIDGVEANLSSIASDLAAHRHDTELHSSPRRKALKTV